MVNINGVLYRSSTNKLQVSSARSPVKSLVAKSNPNAAVSKQRCLTIRGTRFLLDPSGTKLRKVPSMEDSETSEAKLRRIDIGGLTYMPKTDGTFVRTDIHRTRNYLSLAKQKSIQVLTNKMRKCNVSCQIYRRLGKCTAFLRGRCPKLHDPKHISICSKFLKGECSNANCLLSHNVSLEKMPVCRFFLEGRCVRNDCPYLHKKVSEKERVCEDFLKGFCPLADKCQRRHEYICPEYDRFGVCERTKCPYPHGRRDVKRNQKHAQEKPLDKSQHASALESMVRQGHSTQNRRYFLENPDKSNESDSDQLSGVQKAQLRRLLGKVEQMKQGHLEESSGSQIDSLSGLNEDHELIDKQEVIEMASESDEFDDNDENDSKPPITKRAKLGPLPSFIPI